MDALDLLNLFDRLVAETAVELRHLDDWGLSGQRPTQYRHDVVADDIIVGGLRSAGLAVLSEESGLVGGGSGESGGDGVTVVVDPIDGSTNASLGLPWFAASLCAVDRDGPLAALVVNLATGDRYRAIRGRGARHDRSPIRLNGPELADGGTSTPETLGLSFEQSKPITPRRCTDLGEAFVAFSGLPAGHGGWRQFRVLGAAALDMCAVADGTLDGYVDVDRAHGVWDYLGALLVCQEAGALVADWGDEDLVVLEPGARRGPVAGANAELNAQLLAMVRAWV